jgi:transposase InsO family protein
MIEESTSHGARLSEACRLVGVSPRTIQRWQRSPGEDGRKGPLTAPKNKLSELERMRLLKELRCEEHQDLSPCRIVPKLADEGIYLASESTCYRLLKEMDEANHRERSRPRMHKAPPLRTATGPCQLWSWDITYLSSRVRGKYYYLYLMMDVWSRKIVGAAVHDRECSELAAALFEDAVRSQGANASNLVLHSDNGGPMKGSTMVVTLESLGVTASFSRPRVSDDNPYSESLFRTLKYRPWYPGLFESLELARVWVDEFVHWYNHDHLHSKLRFVTPAARHDGREGEILASRDVVYRAARSRHPERWSGPSRDWSPIGEVTLHKERLDQPSASEAA